jgi:poly-gamma-glutamate synthesis protein (capsule biosynthesis protein)
MANKIKIACVGDIMCGDSFYAIGHGVASSLDKYGNKFLPSEILDILSGHDVILGNVEAPLSNKNRKNYVLRSLHMHGRKESAGYLADWGLTVANIANNHILEHGIDTAIDTVHNLQQAGIRTIGAGKEKLFQNELQIEEIICGEYVLAFIGVCLRQEKYAFSGGTELEAILEAIKDLSSQGKIVCISIHWGDEFMDRPSIQQKDIAKKMTEAGARLIIGHHPHVVQGIENINGGLVAYSLGNFIFDSFLSDTKWSLILSITISEKEEIHWEYIPIEKDDEHRPQITKGACREKLELEIKRRCDLLVQKISDDIYIKQYESDVISQDKSARCKLYLELLKKAFSFNPIYWPQILWRPIQRRMGKW